MARKKRSFLEKINPFDKESRERRAKKVKPAQDKRQAKQDVYKKTTSVHPISKHHTKKAVVEKTKGGDYPVYKKKSKTAKSFGAAFKSNCAGKGSGDSFSWQGRSYSCARASDKKGYAGEIGKKNPKYASKIGTSKSPPKDYVKK